jgi:hypothetical protein
MYVDDGLTSAGEVVDHLESLEPAERRRLLDEARRDCGMPTTHEVDEQRQFEIANAAARATAAAESRYQTCGAAHCTVAPVTPEGALMPVDAP